MYRHFIIIVLMIVACCKLKAQMYSRNNNETVDAFVKRIYNVKELAHPVIETREWDSASKVIICFYVVAVPNDNAVIVGNLLVPTSKNRYQQILIDSFPYEDPTIWPTKIETVFFANVDKDAAREIIIQTTNISHSRQGYSRILEGTFYQTYVYDNPDLNNPQKRLPSFALLNKQFGQKFEGDTYDQERPNKDGSPRLIKKSKAKYKTTDAVRRALKEMGF